MYNLNDFFSILDKYAPIKLSQKMIEIGEYDNSGIIVRSSDTVSKAMFALDLTETAVKRAKKLGCNTIVTHHPAIYSPIKTLSYKDTLTNPVLSAIQNKINVISMHLNLDVADNGIDYCLCKGLGAKNYRILDYLDEKHGYGREFSVKDITFKDYVAKIKKEFNTKKVLCYGSPLTNVKKVASFCGAGATHALDYVKSEKCDADVIVTSDIPQHILKELVENDKCVLVLTHYSAENYGFNNYFFDVKKELKGEVEIFFFDDKRLK